MRYLTYVKPDQAFFSKFENLQEMCQKHIYTPSSGLHCTLWGFNLNEIDEDRIIQELEKLKPDIETPLQLQTITSEMLKQEDGTYSLATILDISKGLNNLHIEITKIVRNYDKSPQLFDEMFEKFGGNRYKPHITLSKKLTIQNYDISDSGFVGHKWYVSSFFLSKKKAGRWSEIAEFIF